MSNKVDRWNNKPITKDTATVDIIAKYAAINDTQIINKHLHRDSEGVYIWTLQVGSYPPFIISTSDTRKRCLDGSLLEHAIDLSKIPRILP